jgi:predicted secreted protein
MNHIDLTRADSGRSVAVSVGDVVVVNLPETPTTGYRWTDQAAAHSILQLQSEEFMPGTSGGIGGGGRRVLRYVVLQPGSVDVRFDLARPWEREQRESVCFRIAAT